ncbi:hypothetical protein PvNV_048 [Penaeus vannamei nudivirus]|nr:hypothetical protein PvSNPV_048 [Penaeus vannamei nucleopolyhedrovirus]
MTGNDFLDFIVGASALLLMYLIFPPNLFFFICIIMLFLFLTNPSVLTWSNNTKHTCKCKDAETDYEESEFSSSEYDSMDDESDDEEGGDDKKANITTTKKQTAFDNVKSDTNKSVMD